FLRVPGWSRGAALKVNGQRVVNFERVRGYAHVRRNWKRGDTVEIEFPMPVERVKAHPLVDNNTGRVALMRGPVVYCLESVDNDAAVRTLILPRGVQLTAE